MSNVRDSGHFISIRLYATFEINVDSSLRDSTMISTSAQNSKRLTLLLLAGTATSQRRLEIEHAFYSYL